VDLVVKVDEQYKQDMGSQQQQIVSGVCVCERAESSGFPQEQQLLSNFYSSPQHMQLMWCSRRAANEPSTSADFKGPAHVQVLPTS
jgi:hypothetical protein